MSSNKLIIRSIIGLLMTVGCAASVWAEWEVSSAQSPSYSDSFFQGGAGNTPDPNMLAPSLAHDTSYPDSALNVPAPVYAISISGSLKQNLERIFKRYHWKLVWKAPYDYNFDGRVSGASVPDVMEQLLKMFPLQAIMYMSNKTVLIIPRHKQYE